MSGKTEWVKRLLEHKDNMMSPIQIKVLLCYKYWQPSYTEMLKIMPNDLFQSKNFNPSVSSLIVFDDLMRTVMNDHTAADLFTEGAYHRNISAIFIIQIFSKASKVETQV